MKILALMKEVPDTYGERRLNLETGLADRAASEAILDEISERTLEVALSYADAQDDTEVVAAVMAPEGATATVRKVLAMGADSAIHIVDEALVGADMVLTAEVLAAAVRRSGFDLVLTGSVSTDGSGGMVPAAIAEFLGVPHLTAMSSVEISGSSVSGTRPVDGGVQQVSAPLPAVVSVTEALPAGRFPNFKGIMAAKKKPLEVLRLADLGVIADDPSAARSIMIQVQEKPPRVAGVKITDEGDGGEKLAAYLIQNHLV